MIARCARLPSRPGLAGAAKDRSRCIRPVMHFYSAKPMHFYSGVDKGPTSVGTQSSNTLKFSKMQIALAFVIAGISDAIGAFITPLRPIGWVTDVATVLLLFLVL